MFIRVVLLINITYILGYKSHPCIRRNPDLELKNPTLAKPVNLKVLK